MDKMINVGFGIFMIIFGIIIVWYVSKRTTPHPLFSIKIQGYAFGVGSILFGIMYIFNKLKLW